MIASAESHPVETIVDGPSTELLSPAWPLKISVSLGLTILLGLVAALPALLTGPDRLTLMVLAIPMVAAAPVGRLLFQLLAGSATRTPTTALAAVAAGAVTSGLGFLLATATGVPVAPAAALGAWAVAAALLGLAAAIRRLELRVGASARRLFFIGSDAQYLDLAREVARRGDMRLVGRAGTAERGLVRRILAARSTTVVMSSEATRSEPLVAAAAEVHKLGTRVRPLDEFYERHFGKVAVGELTNAWFLFDVAEIHRPRVYGAAKRLLESSVAAVLLVLLLPLLPFAALAIRRSSPGPIFYRQQRIGLNGRLVTLTKLRTMTVAAPDGPQAWATQDVARITPAGRLLRKFRLDEAPQLWHVLRGDLSLVGPRPEQPRLVESLSSAIKLYPTRHVVRPGLTGWAQVNHGYGGSVDEALEKLQYDLFYIRHQGIRLDLLILMATVRTVLSGGGR